MNTTFAPEEPKEPKEPKNNDIQPNERNGGLLAFSAFHAQTSLLEYLEALEGQIEHLDGNYATELYNDLIIIREYITEIESMLIAKL